MRWLLLGTLLLAGCPDNLLPSGKQGSSCYQNGSCDWGLTCLQWKAGDGGHKSVCAAPQDVKVGYAELVGIKCDQKTPDCPKCPDPPVIRIAALSCPEPPPPVHCPPPVKCPPPPPSVRCPECASCPEVKACAPGWHRPSE